MVANIKSESHRGLAIGWARAADASAFNFKGGEGPKEKEENFDGSNEYEAEKL